MDGKVIFVTGSTDGIGKQTARELVKTGATILLHGRNSSLGNNILELIKKESNSPHVELYIADFSSLKQVRQLAEQICKNHSRLDVLVNNAGVYMRNRQLTENGFETTFAVNHLASFLLTNLLLDLLRKSAPARIINVSSMAHRSARFDLDNLQGEKHFEPYDTYSRSKLANLLFTYKLARRLANPGVTVNALHPGVIATKMLKVSFGFMGGSPATEGAARISHLIITPGLEKVSGKYFVNDKEQISSPLSRDVILQEGLWTLSETMVGIDSRKGD